MSEKNGGAEHQQSTSLAGEHLGLSPQEDVELSDGQLSKVSGGLSPHRVTGIEPSPLPPSPIPIPYPDVSKR